MPKYISKQNKIKHILLGTSLIISLATTLISGYLVNEEFNQPSNRSQAALNTFAFTGAGQYVCNGNSGSQLTPVPIQNISNVRMSDSAGSGSGLHTLFVRTDGTVWGTGSNIYREVIPNNVDFTSPTPIPGLSNVKAVSVSLNYSFALKNDDTLWSWGRNHVGQLGQGTFTDNPTPTQIMTNVRTISAGLDHVVAVKNDGTVWAWGANTDGALGNGNTTTSNTPIQVPGLTDFVAANTSYNPFSQQTVALKNDGTVWAWGDGSLGSLGQGNTADSFIPVQVRENATTFLTGVTQLLPGESNATQVRKADNTIWEWGYFEHLATPRSSPNSFAAQITAFDSTQVRSISVNLRSTSYVKNDGTVWSYGLWAFSGLGTGGTVNVLANNPTQVPGITGADKIFGQFVIKTDGTVVGWGANSGYSLGNSTTVFPVTRPIPITQSDIAFADIGTNAGIINVVKTDGTLWNCGGNTFGQLGNGTTNSNYNWNQVTGISNVVKTTQLVNASTVALKSDGTVWRWGNNNFGGIPPSLTPVQLPGISNIVDIASTQSVIMMLDSSGNLSTIGAPIVAGTNSTTPTVVLTNVSKVAGMLNSIAALKTDGTVWTVGGNSRGELGNGNLTTTTTFNQVAGISNVTDIATGGLITQSIVALKSDGTVWSWGRGDQGRLGTGSFANSTTPTQIPGLSGITQITGNSALRPDGKVMNWGEKSFLGRLNQSELQSINGASPVENQFINNVTNIYKTNGGNIFKGDTLNIATLTDVINLTMNCTSAQVSTTTTCSFTLPPDLILDFEIKFGIGNSTPAGVCTREGQLITCISIPTGSEVGVQPIKVQIGLQNPANTGENVTINPRPFNPVIDIENLSSVSGLTCTPTSPVAESIVSCTGTLPNAIIPPTNLRIGTPNSLSNCTFIGQTFTCSNINVGSNTGDINIVGSIGASIPLNTGLTVTVVARDFNPENDLANMLSKTSLVCSPSPATTYSTIDCNGVFPNNITPPTNLAINVEGVTGKQVVLNGQNFSVAGLSTGTTVGVRNIQAQLFSNPGQLAYTNGTKVNTGLTVTITAKLLSGNDLTNAGTGNANDPFSNFTCGTNSVVNNGANSTTCTGNLKPGYTLPEDLRIGFGNTIDGRCTVSGQTVTCTDVSVPTSPGNYNLKVVTGGQTFTTNVKITVTAGSSLVRTGGTTIGYLFVSISIFTISSTALYHSIKKESKLYK